MDDTPTTIEQAYSSPNVTCGRKQYGVRRILSCLMELGRWLIVHMDASLLVANGCLKKA
jgi:hypothetical protein